MNPGCATESKDRHRLDDLRYWGVEKKKDPSEGDMGPLYRRPCRAFTPCFLYENEEVENEFLDMEVPQRSSSFHEW